jgi:tRNA pseudouridine38-40 synthase
MRRPARTQGAGQGPGRPQSFRQGDERSAQESATRTLFDPAPFSDREAGASSGEEGSECRSGVPSEGGGHRDLLEDFPSDVVRLRLVVAYEGSGFRGFAAQNGQRTVAGELSRAIATVARHPVELVCAGRTDAGVHASGQVAHVDVRRDVSPERLAKSVNAMLGPTIVVRSAIEAPPSFDARRSARSRRYRYLVMRSDTPDPLLAPLAWHVRDRLELRSMSAASDCLLGEHDFSAFCRRPPGAPSDRPLTRRVIDARWSRLTLAGRELAEGAALLCFEISAPSFCHQMVRSIVGTVVDVGRGRRRASDVTWLLKTGDRSRATTIAPPQGLCLVGVDY